MMTRENEILQYLLYHPGSSRSEIEAGMNLTESPATVKRILASLVDNGSVTYFEKETDERGELPARLNRGVLSEDGLYNLLQDPVLAKLLEQN